MPAWADQTLLERDEPLAILTDALAAGTGSMIVVSGPAGIGKTSLVRRATVGADPVWLGAGRPPLMSIVDGARVVVFEDVHSADPATLRLLRFLDRDRARSTIVVTADGSLDELSPDVRLSLAPLSAEATEVLVDGSGLDPALVFSRTGGNPFFITAVLAAGTEEPPATVRDAVLARLFPLVPDTRDALEAAAAVGSRLESAVLATVLHRLRIPGWTIRDAVMSGFLHRDGTSLEFWHDLAREAIAEATDPSRRPRLHDAIFLALRQIHPRSHTGLRAHAEAAGRTRDAHELREQRRLALAHDLESQRQFWLGNPSTAMEWAAKALAAEATDPDVAASARISHAGARLLAGDLTAIDDLRVPDTRALFHLGWLPTLHRHHAGLEPVLHQALAHTARLGLTHWNQLLAGARLSYLLDTGRWAEVDALAPTLLRDALTLPTLQAYAALVRLTARRGTPDDHLTDTLRDLAKRHPKADLYAGATPALAEAAWLAGNPDLVHTEAVTALTRTPHLANPWWHGELAYWCHRAGTPLPATAVAEPYRLSLAGDWQAAASWWHAHQCPYQSALARTESPDPATIQAAIDTLTHLGAPTAATHARTRLHTLS